tara:strand:+ start:60471 stop:61172 length:702 start_codon:yes stop_codon:yes gene_type:complete
MHRLNDYFEKIYVISLRSARNRRDHITNLSKKFDFKFEFVDAVDYKTIDVDKLKKEKKIAYPGNTFFCTRKCTCKGLGHELNVKQLGPNLSHLKVWNKIIDLNLGNALILEDDCHFKPGFQNSFNEVAENFPKNWNYICLGRNNKFKNSKKKIQKIKRGFSGGQLYGMSYLAAIKGVEHFFPMRANLDGYLDYFLIQKRYGSVGLKKCYASTENLGINGSVEGKFETSLQKYF